ncbi:SH3 domain-containing protein [Lacinutrix sp.]|uniref:SH3 domain-containing protein n=1 Tax=Lacinutrix sp. TaxID=1937692 RepID=UPI0025C0C3A8|nr:SH3 domain-containing protein [Lacinutrix sp.]
MKILKNIITALVLLITVNVFAQNTEVVFDTYVNATASQSSKYLLANNVALRDCPATQCQKATTLPIGMKVRLLEKSECPVTINGVTSSFYKVKVGPDTGWIFGGLISQKTMKSTADPSIMFVFGEKGVTGSNDDDITNNYQIRAVKNGVEIDRLTIDSQGLDYANVTNIGNKGLENVDDVISLSLYNGETCDAEENTLYVVWEGNTLKKRTNVIVFTDSISGGDCCSLFDN